MAAGSGLLEGLTALAIRAVPAAGGPDWPALKSVTASSLSQLQSFDFLFGNRTPRVIIVHPVYSLSLAQDSEVPTMSVRRVVISLGLFPFLPPRLGNQRMLLP